MPPSRSLAIALRGWRSSRARFYLRLGVLRLAAMRHTHASGPVHVYLHNVSASEAAAFEQLLDDLAPIPFRTMQQVDADSKSVAFSLSFDDGFRDHARVVAPILRRRRIPATLFVASGLVGLTGDELETFTRRGLQAKEVLPALDRDDVRRWVDAGLDVGSHGVSHTSFSMLDAESARRELRESREFLEDVAGVQVSRFAWPFGSERDFPAMYVPLAHSSGYTAVYSGISRHRPRALPPGAIHRRQLALGWGPAVCRYMAVGG